MHAVHIILVHPQLAANVGSVARVMSNFGITSLRIVSPRDGWPPAVIAYNLAAKGADVLNSAVVYDCVDAAISDLNLLVAVSARCRYMEKQMVLANKMDDLFSDCFKCNNVGIMFGRENNGLSNDELLLSDAIVTIPTHHGNSSLNLAQSVAIVCYELFCIKNKMNFLTTHSNTSANKGDLQSFINQMIIILETKKYFTESRLKTNVIQNLHNTFVKARLTNQEINTLLGMFKAIAFDKR